MPHANSMLTPFFGVFRRGPCNKQHKSGRRRRAPEAGPMSQLTNWPRTVAGPAAGSSVHDRSGQRQIYIPCQSAGTPTATTAGALARAPTQVHRWPKTSLFHAPLPFCLGPRPTASTSHSGTCNSLNNGLTRRTSLRYTAACVWQTQRISFRTQTNCVRLPANGITPGTAERKHGLAPERPLLAFTEHTQY
jgi:hypothetical protein